MHLVSCSKTPFCSSYAAIHLLPVGDNLNPVVLLWLPGTLRLVTAAASTTSVERELVIGSGILARGQHKAWI